ncbi:MAG TPA: GNAT family N-acetyltransferase [Micromonosporaceae bacterium]|nr:GNAT family N-acetyltransferase [Micromonosporaceae bacterium]
MTEVTVVHRPERSRYEVRVDGETAGYTRYRRSPDGSYIDFRHTEIDPAYEGQGLGARLVAEALDDVRRRGDRAIATCPFVAAFVKRHPEYADLVVADP